MKIKLSEHQYSWQPEISLSVIYWSLTFGVFFLSIIVALEKTHITIVSVLIFLFFLFLCIIGYRRYFEIQKDSLYVHTLLPKNRLRIKIDKIEKISIGFRGCTLLFTDNEHQKTLMVLMRNKEKEKFIKKIKSNCKFTGEILSTDKTY